MKHANDTEFDSPRENGGTGVPGNESGYVLMVVTVLLVTVSVAIGIAMTRSAGFREQRAVHRFEKTRIRMEADGLLDLAVQYINDWDSAYQFCSRCVCGPGEDTAYYCPYGTRVHINGFHMTADCEDCDPQYRYCWSGGMSSVGGGSPSCWWAKCINDTSDVRDPSMPFCVFDSGFDVGSHISAYKDVYVTRLPNSLPQLRDAAYIRTSGQAFFGNAWFKKDTDTTAWDFCSQALLRWGFNVDQPSTVWLIWIPEEDPAPVARSLNRQFGPPQWLANGWTLHHDSMMVDRKGTEYAAQLWYRQAHPDLKYPMYRVGQHFTYTPTAHDLQDSVNVLLFPAFFGAENMYGVVVTPGGPFRCKTRDLPGDPKIVTVKHHRYGHDSLISKSRFGLTILNKNSTPAFDARNRHGHPGSLDILWPDIVPAVNAGFAAYFAEVPERYDSTWYLVRNMRDARKLDSDSAHCHDTTGRAFYMELTVDYPCTVFVGIEKKWFENAYTAAQPYPFAPYHYPCDAIRHCMIYPTWEDSLYIWNQKETLPTSTCVGTPNEMGPQMNPRYRPYFWMLNDTALVEFTKGKAHLDTLPPGYLSRRYFRRMLDDTVAWSYFHNGDTIRHTRCNWIDHETPPMDTGECEYQDIIMYQRRALLMPGDTLRLGPVAVIFRFPDNVGMYNAILKPVIRPEDAWVWDSFVDTTWTLWEGRGDTLIDGINLNRTDRGKVTVRCAKPNFFQVDATVYMSQNGRERYKTTVNRDFSKATGKPQNAFRRDYGK